MALEDGCKAAPASARGDRLSDKELTCLTSGRIRRGKLNLVDLAGSERQAKTGT